MILEGGGAKEKALIRYVHKAFVYYTYAQKQVFEAAMQACPEDCRQVIGTSQWRYRCQFQHLLTVN